MLDQVRGGALAHAEREQARHDGAVEQVPREDEGTTTTAAAASGLEVQLLEAPDGLARRDVDARRVGAQQVLELAQLRVERVVRVSPLGAVDCKLGS